MRALVPVALAALLFLPAPALAGGLAGTWLLERQVYGDGAHNFAGPDRPFRLVFSPAGAGTPARAERSGASAPWPCWFTPRGPVPVQDARVVPDPDGRGVTATYRVPPAPGDDTWLVVTERYRLTPGDRLAGTVDVRFERHGVLRGGFTWRRTFRREADR